MSAPDRPLVATSSDRAMRAYYAARAASYDSIYRKPERQADLRAIEARLPSRFSAAELLEVACGTGYWTRFLAPEARSIIAVDAAVETLTIADSRLCEDEVGRERVRFVVGDAYALPVRSGSFDGAFAGFWFSHVPRVRRRAFVAGLCRALRPGALVVLLDNRYVAGSSTPIARVDDAGDCWQQRPLADGSAQRVLKNFPEPVELDAAIAGFGTAGTFIQWPYYWAFTFRTLAVADRDLSSSPSMVHSPSAAAATAEGNAAAGKSATGKAVADKAAASGDPRQPE